MKVVFAGSFDPISLGHLDIIERASKMFDEVVVLVANNCFKRYMFDANKRVELVKKSIKQKNVSVDILENGLLVDYLKKNDIKIILRSVRSYKDFEFETILEYNNKILADNIETIYLNTAQNLSHINSSIVKDIFVNNGDISQMVPNEVLVEMQKLKQEL